MNFSRRIAAVLLAALLILNMLPTAVHAAEAISAITVTGISVPTPGEYPDYNQFTLSTKGLHVTGAGTYLNWYYSSDNQTWESMKHDDLRFEYGCYYKMVSLFEPDEGYYFASSVSATVNGYDAQVEINKEHNYATVTCYFSPMSRTTIMNVDLVIPDEPAVGESPNYTDVFTPTLTNGAYYVRPYYNSTKTVRWFVSEDGDSFREMADDELFAPGFFYKCCMRVLSDTASVFSDNTVSTVNGRLCCTVQWGFTDAIDSENGTYADMLVIECLFPSLLKGTITELSVTGIPEPVPGKDYETETYTLPEDANYSLFGAETTLHWYYSRDGVDYHKMKEPLAEGYNYLPFRCGYYHKLVVGFLADRAYEIAEDCTVMINGRPAAVIGRTEFEGQTYVSAEYVFEPIMLGTVSDIVLNDVSRPVIGASPRSDFYTIPDNSGYQLECAEVNLHYEFSDDGVSYEEMRFGEESDLVFQKGRYYRMWAVISPLDGYDLAKDMKVTVNGIEGKVESIDMSDGVPFVKISVDFGQLSAKTRNLTYAAIGTAGGASLITLLALAFSRRKKGAVIPDITK